MQKASILFYSLTLLLIVSVAALVMVSLFFIQTETLIMVREGNIAHYAAHSGVENAKNSIYARAVNFTPEICNGFLRSGNISKTFQTYAPDDTSYSVSYSFTCSTILLPPDSPSFQLDSYTITSIGIFENMTIRTVVFNWIRP